MQLPLCSPYLPTAEFAVRESGIEWKRITITTIAMLIHFLQSDLDIRVSCLLLIYAALVGLFCTIFSTFSTVLQNPSDPKTGPSVT